jgi:hypothetical protein
MMPVDCDFQKRSMLKLRQLRGFADIGKKYEHNKAKSQ